ncbi:MAG: NAD(P)/FAD-dependent oxidoreductase [Aggregatilineales bacterium]
MTTIRPRVIIIGAGFGGLYAARTLAKHEIDILLIDRNNFHLFTPLLYQVATCGLDPSEIAYPIRSIFRKNKNVQFLLGEVNAIDREAKQVSINANGKTLNEAYDYLIIAAGSVTNYFNNGALEQNGFGLKTLSDAVRLRNHILKLFERATWTDDPQQKAALTTMVVVGGGPTGLETSGALYELYNNVLKHEFSKEKHMRARVILVEAMDRLLIPYPERLQESALEQLKSLGVEVILGQSVKEAALNHVILSSGDVIRTHTLVWAAGVKGAPFAEMLGVDAQRGGRIAVDEMLLVDGVQDVYAVGDIAYLIAPDGQPYPQVIPVAQQQGTLAAKNILSAIGGESGAKFTYSDRGIMATIGRSRAVAYPYYKVQLTGFLAWITWLFLHLLWLMGFRNRLNVFVNWIWNYLTYDRSVRIILERTQDEQMQRIEDSYIQTPPTE